MAQTNSKENTNVLMFDSREQKTAREIPVPIQRIVEGLGEGREAGLVRYTFTFLVELLADLQSVEGVEAGEGVIEESIAAFSSVHDKVLDLVSHLEEQVLLLEDISASSGSAMLDVSFALRHELRRAFDLDIAHIDGERPFESAEGRVAHAHGVLRNCFRQSVVLLAQVFDASLNERDVFADAASRRQESILLCDALSSLVSAIEEATIKSFPQSAVSVIEHLDSFRHDGMSYLMRRDWEMFDAFENEIISSKDEEEFAAAAKTLRVGLETLLGQVRMRTAFSEGAATETTHQPSRRGVSFSLFRGRPALWSAVAASAVLAFSVAFFADFTLKTQGRERAAAPVVESVLPMTVSSKTEHVAAQPKVEQVAEQPKVEPVAEQTQVAVAPEMVKKVAAPINQTEQKQAGGLTLQVGAFRDRAAALESVARLRSAGVEARVTEARKDAQVVYRVQVGHFKSSAEASQLGRQLMAKGAASSFIVTKVA